MARNPKVELRGHEGQIVHPITDGDCVIFPNGETLSHKLSEQEEVMYAPEVTNSSPMFKVGEGDSSDYSANVLDGAYQKVTLKGQTYVNAIQEPSADVITLPTPFTEYERTQSKTFTEMQDGTFGLNLVGQSYVNCIQEPSEPSYVALGENLEFQNKKVKYTNDGQIKSAMLKGQTLVNVDSYYTKNDFQTNNIDTIASDGYITMTANNTWRNAHTNFNNMLKPNTQYLLILEIKENTLEGGTQPFRLLTGSAIGSEGAFEGQALVVNHGQTGMVKHIVTTKSDLSTCIINSRNYISNTVTSGIIVYRTMLIEYQEGMENWDIPFFRGMQSVTMSTELENICSRYNSSLAKSETTFTVNNSMTRSLYLSTPTNIGLYGFKPYTRYLIQFKISNLNLDGLQFIKLTFSNDSVASGNCLFGEKTDLPITKNGVYRTVLTTTNVISTSSFVIKGFAPEWEGTSSTARTLKISEIMCIEYQNGMENWDLPYFETTQLMKPIIINSSNKNLICLKDIMNGKSINPDNGDILNSELRQISGLIKVKPNTTYTVSQDYTATQQQIFIHQYSDKYISSTCAILWERDKVQANDNQDMNSYYVWAKNKATFTTSSNAKYIVIRTQNNMTIIGSKIQVEEANTNSTYIVPQTQRISALEPITLRAIGNVKDTLDLSTGEYVQRIGEIVFDGSDDEGWYYTSSTSDAGALRFSAQVSGRKYYSGNIVACDKYRNVVFGKLWDGTEDKCIAGWGSGNHVNIRDTRYTTLADFKASLASNPIKVQYELANPITRKISLEYPNLQTYKNVTHVQSVAMDGTLIPNIYLPSDIAYKTLLKPSTVYNIHLKQNVVETDNPLTVNIGGTEAIVSQPHLLISTPSTLTNDTLSFTGKGNDIGEVMLIENRTLLDGDIPYFEGIGDVHLGRVVENLCMSNESFAGGATVTTTLYVDKVQLKITKEGSCVETFELTKQLENGKKYFVYCPNSVTSSNCSTLVASFKRIYNGSINYTRQMKAIPSEGKITFNIEQTSNPYTHLVIGEHGQLQANSQLTIRRPILCEYIEGMENWDWESIGYFTGTKNIGNEFMRISNKNLFVKYYDKINIIGISNISIKTDNTIGATRMALRLYDKDFQPILNRQAISCRNQFYYSHDNKWSLASDRTQVIVENIKIVDKNIAFVTIEKMQDTNIEYNNIQLEKATSATSYVAHKHNSLHILPNEQIPLTFVQGVIIYGQNSTWESAINNTNANRIRTQLLDLEPNETYRISCGSTNHSFAILGYNTNLLGKFDSGWTYDEYYFTTTKDVHKYAINVRYKDDSNITPSVLHQVRLEKVTDVHLRSIRNVKDELDLTRGVYVQRINEKILDGSYGISRVTNKDTCTLIQYNVEDKKQGSNYNPISNKFNRGDWDSRIPYEVYCGNSYDMYFMVPLSLNITTIDEAKAWFKNNNVIVQYELATPIEHKINIPMKNESNQTIAKPNGIFTLPLMYSETNHVDINSQIYPKVQSRDYISYPVIANNSQLHTVFHNKVGTGNLTVNLCGTSVTSVDGASKCTVTTPSAISQYELRLSGARNKVSNVCVFSGDYMNVDVPYVQGMMNAVNPIVKNIGKNLFDGMVKNGEAWWNGKTEILARCRRSVNLTPVKPNTEYIFKLTNGYGANFMAHGKDGKFLKYIGWVLSEDRLIIPSDCYYIHWYNDIDDFTDFYIEESPTPSQYEPYKENILKTSWSIGYNAMIKGKSISSANGTSINNAPNRYRTDFIKIEFAKIYINSNNPYCLFLYDINKKYLGRFTDSWVTDREFEFNESNAYYFIVVFKTDNGEDTTTYISSKETRITLRSLPNGVYDELNLETGEYIQRIGEYTLNGDEDWRANTGLNTNRTSFFYLNNGKKPIDMPRMSVEKLSYANAYGFVSGMSEIRLSLLNKQVEAVMGGDGENGMIQVMIAKDKLYNDSLDDFKEYLSRQPITVQYQLDTPIVKQIDINNFPHSYKDGHVVIENNDPSTNVTAQMIYQCVANRTGQIQEHTEQIEKQEHEINELEMLILENIRQQQNR